MQELATQAWTPWIAWLVLGGGTILLLATFVVPLRGLPRALTGLRSGATTAGGTGPLWLPLAAATGMGGVTGGMLAVTTGGPGALPWMWVTTVLGMAIVFAEASLSARRPSDQELGSIYLLAAPKVGKLLAPMYAVAVVALALVLGAAFQTNQAGVVLESTLGIPAATAAIVLAVAAAPLVMVASLRRVVLMLVPAALLIYVVMAASALGEDSMLLSLQLGDAFNQAFGVAPAAGGAAGGGVGLAIAHGVLRATMAGEAGLGTGALLDLRGRSRGTAGAVVMLVPLLAAGLVGSLSGMLMLGAQDAGTPMAEPKLVPLEQYFSRGLRPSQQVGQTIVLPAETTMEANKVYGMKLRSNPRGHAFGKLVKEQNHVAFPLWAIGEEGADTVTFRAADERGEQAAWDVHIPCEREIKSIEDGDLQYVLLRPKDPEIDLYKMAVRLELTTTPYINFGDFSFPGQVGRATSPDASLGEHLAMFEAPNADRPFNPKLHEFFRAGYRGPYADEDSPRPPWGFVASEGFDAPPGTVLDLKIVGDPRGNEVLSVTRSGTVEAPAWDLLQGATTMVMRHDEDPALDIRMKVTPRYELYRTRFAIDGWDVKAPAGYQGPFLVVLQEAYEAFMAGQEAPETMDERKAALMTRGGVVKDLGPFSEQKPPPKLVLDAKKLILRDPEDASRNIIIPALPVHDGDKVRLELDMRAVAKLEGYSGPYLVVPDYTFRAEVRGDTRLGEEFEGRRTLVPLDVPGEVMGPHGEGDLYTPHPAELLDFGLTGPVLDHQGAQQVVDRIVGSGGSGSRTMVALAIFVFALSTIVGWAELGGRAATAVAGSIGAPLLKVTMLAAAAAGAVWSLEQMLPLIDLLMGAVVVPSVIGLLLMLSKVRAAAAMKDDLAEEPAADVAEDDA